MTLLLFFGLTLATAAGLGLVLLLALVLLEVVSDLRLVLGRSLALAVAAVLISL